MGFHVFEENKSSCDGKRVKACGYTFSESNSAIFISFCLLSQWGWVSALKGKNLLSKGQILSVRVDPTLEGHYCPGKQTVSHH